MQAALRLALAGSVLADAVRGSDLAAPVRGRRLATLDRLVRRRVLRPGTTILHLRTGGSVTETGAAAAKIVETTLAIESDGLVSLPNANDIDVLGLAFGDQGCD